MKKQEIKPKCLESEYWILVLAAPSIAVWPSANDSSTSKWRTAFLHFVFKLEWGFDKHQDDWKGCTTVKYTIIRAEVLFLENGPMKKNPEFTEWGLGSNSSSSFVSIRTLAKSLSYCRFQFTYLKTIITILLSVVSSKAQYIQRINLL